jgi:very-short-patch-repair endonuclease
VDAVGAVEALNRLGGAATHADLLRLTTRKRLRAAVARGAVAKVEHGRYALPEGDLAHEAVRRLRGHLSHLSAARRHGWEVAKVSQWPQLVVPPGTEVPLDLARAETWELVVTRRDLENGVTGKVLTVLLCARDLPFVEALAVADSALRHGDVTDAQLTAAAAGWPEQVGRVAAYADGRSANPFESALRAHAIDAGLRVVPQWEIRAGGATHHVDLADPVLGIALEADSWEFHADRQAFERDCRRYNRLVLADWRVLRYTWAEVVLGGGAVVKELRELAERLKAG